MSLEERIELHDQWLRSMESNQSQFAANLAALERNTIAFQQEARQQFTQVTAILEQVVRHQAVLSDRIETLTTQVTRLADRVEQISNTVDRLGQRVDQLSQTVDRYIRYRGDGQEPN